MPDTVVRRPGERRVNRRRWVLGRRAAHGLGSGHEVFHVWEVAMPGQEHVKPQRRDEEPPETPEAPPTAPAGAAVKEGLSDDIDSVLDEIDGVLESNAEEFVRG